MIQYVCFSEVHWKTVAELSIMVKKLGIKQKVPSLNSLIPTLAMIVVQFEISLPLNYRILP